MNQNGDFGPDVLLSDEAVGTEGVKPEVIDAVVGVVENTNVVVELSPEAQKRTIAIQRFPHLEGKVKITNEKILVITEIGELSFGFFHIEGGQFFDITQKPYTKKQLEALIKVFGIHSSPYLEILGMKNTNQKGGIYNDNFYWSSSHNVKCYIWGLYLKNDKVLLISSILTSTNSAISQQN